MYTEKIAVAALLAAVLGMAGCDMMQKEQPAEDAADGEAGQVAVAEIRPSGITTTRPALGQPSGTVRFVEQGGQVRMVADISGLKPNSTHGFHIHEKGDLSAPDLSSTGGHYNPGGHTHAGPEAPEHHAGDLGNITTDAQGRAHKEMIVEDVSLTGENPIVGRAVIVHADPDDLQSDPAGNAGARIGGGVIELQQP